MKKRYLKYGALCATLILLLSIGVASIPSKSEPTPGSIVPPDDSSSTAKASWDPVGNREAIYRIDHLFENYMKAQNYTKAAHGDIQRIQERYLGHHNQSVMGNNEWLNSSLGASPR